jgi:hypothetical protein
MRILIEFMFVLYINKITSCMEHVWQAKLHLLVLLSVDGQIQEVIL